MVVRWLLGGGLRAARPTDKMMVRYGGPMWASAPTEALCIARETGDRKGRPYAFISPFPIKKRWPFGHLS